MAAFRFVRWAPFASVCMLLIAATAGAQPRLSYEDLLAHLTDLDKLPAIEPGVSCRQFSSYDRRSKYDEANDKYINWDANGDAGQYLRIESNGEGVMAEMEGPGCIFRLWSANPQGVIRFYLDGDTKPTYEWDFHKLFTGTIEPFIEPLVWKRAKDNPNSASDCYLPIPFAKSCKVTSLIPGPDGKGRTPGHYYIIDYRTFPKDWQVESFKLPLTAEQQKAVEKTAALWKGGSSEDYRSTTKTVAPGGTLEVVNLNGSGVLKELRLKAKSKERWATRKLLVRAYWDGEDTPAIDSPIGDFFGEPRDIAYQSYPMKIEKDMDSCFFPMPFRKSARVVVVNQGSESAEITSSYGNIERAVPENWGYFYAKYRQEKEGSTFEYPLLRATGTGKLVGICLFPDNIHGGWWGEGDEKVFVDGEKFPSWFGTGSEDFFGDAWGIQHFVNPSHGHPLHEIQRMQGCYRWFLGDNIPFYKSFKMTIENYAALPGEKVKNDYYSVAYWYQLPGGKDFFREVPMPERIPRGKVVADAIEAEDAADKEIRSAIIEDSQLPRGLSRGRGVKLTGKIGEVFPFSIDVPGHDRFVLEALTAERVKSSQFEIILLNNKAAPVPVGKYAELRAGTNHIGVRFTGQPVEDDRCEVIVDCFRASVYRNMITQWAWIGPFANPGGKGLDSEYPPEKEMKLAATYHGRGEKEVKWQVIERKDGMFMMQEQVTPRENCILYGACVVKAPKAGSYDLLLGSDDGVKVFVNGQEVFKKSIERAVKIDDDRIPVDLKEGENLLLIKIQQGGGDMGWAARFADPEERLQFAIPK